MALVPLLVLALLAGCADDGSSGGETSTTEAVTTTTTSASTSTGATTPATTEASQSTSTGPSSSEDATTATGASSEGGDTTGEIACDAERIELAPARTGMHPEGISYDRKRGSLLVSGFLTGDVLRVDPCTEEVTEFLAAGVAGNIAGVLVDPELDTLWVCGSDFGQMPPNPRVTAIALADGAVIATHAFPEGGGICNDLTLDGDGNLYLTDSFANRIVRLSAEDKALEGDQAATVSAWSADAVFGALLPGTFGLNGIAWDGAGNLLAVGFHGHISDDDPMALDPSHLYRIPIEAGGTAGPAEILGDIPFGDGLEWLEGSTFLVNEQSSVVSILSVESGGLSVTPIASGLDFSTTSAVVGEDIWVVEGQLDHFLDPNLGPATDPFAIRRFALPR